MSFVSPHTAWHIAGLLNCESENCNLISAHLKAIKVIYAFIPSGILSTDNVSALWIKCRKT